MLNVLESLEIDSKDFFEEVPIHGVVEDSGDEESSNSDDGSGDDEAGYVNGGLFLSRFVQGRIFSYNSSDSGSQSDDDSNFDGYSSSGLEDIGPGTNWAGYQDSQRTRGPGPEDQNGMLILKGLCIVGWSWILLVFVLGMPFLLSTLSVAMVIAMGS